MSSNANKNILNNARSWIFMNEMAMTRKQKIHVDVIKYLESSCRSSLFEILNRVATSRTSDMRITRKNELKENNQ